MLNAHTKITQFLQTPERLAVLVEGPLLDVGPENHFHRKTYARKSWLLMSEMQTGSLLTKKIRIRVMEFAVSDLQVASDESQGLSHIYPALSWSAHLKADLQAYSNSAVPSLQSLKCMRYRITDGKDIQ